MGRPGETILLRTSRTPRLSAVEPRLGRPVRRLRNLGVVTHPHLRRRYVRRNRGLLMCKVPVMLLPRPPMDLLALRQTLRLPLLRLLLPLLLLPLMRRRLRVNPETRHHRTRRLCLHAVQPPLRNPLMMKMMMRMRMGSTTPPLRSMCPVCRLNP